MQYLRILSNIIDLKHALHKIYILERTHVVLSHVRFSDDIRIDKNLESRTNTEPPTNCCMSGCANCVWIQYAEELTKIFKDGGEKSRELILSKVDDPNMKAFLLMELRVMESKKT